MKIAKDFKSLINLVQPKGPHLHNHWVRFKSLVMAIMREDSEFDLINWGKGKLLMVLFLLSLTNEHVSNTLTQEKWTYWADFEHKVVAMAQTETG